MGYKYSIRDQRGIYFVTFTVINWLDLFIRDQYKEIFMDSLRYCQENKGLEVYAYCIMTSHVHLIISVKEGHELSSVIRDIKSFTSRKIRIEIETSNYESRKGFLLWMMKQEGVRNPRNKDFQLWQQNNHPIELATNDMLDQRLDYIHQNPVVAGFVTEANTWKWSSCASYEKNEIDQIDITYIT